MGLEVVVVIVVAAIVLYLFGAKKRRKQENVTKVIVIDDDDDVIIRSKSGNSESDSPLKRLAVAVVSLGAGFAVAGFVIVQFIEPEIGPVDPTSPVAFGLYFVFALIIYGLIRAFSRKS